MSRKAFWDALSVGCSTVGYFPLLFVAHSIALACPDYTLAKRKMAKNDTTSSVFMTKEKFSLAAKECELSAEVADKQAEMQGKDMKDCTWKILLRIGGMQQSGEWLHYRERYLAGEYILCDAEARENWRMAIVMSCNAVCGIWVSPASAAAPTHQLPPCANVITLPTLGWPLIVMSSSSLILGSGGM